MQIMLFSILGSVAALSAVVQAALVPLEARQNGPAPPPPPTPTWANGSLNCNFTDPNAIVPRECLSASALGPQNGTQNISTSYVPVPADFSATPNYNVKSNFDFQSLNLACHQEDIERAVFEQALQNFTLSQWEDAGLNATDLALLAWMAEQEVNHKLAFANMIGENAPQPCTYKWPFADPKGFIEYALLNTRYGESGTIGWVPLLDNRASGNIVIQAITTESRQQYTFRQWRGLFPMPVSFEPAIIQPYHWTLLSRDIVSCPSSNKPVGWPIFPSLNVTNQPAYPNLPPRITQNDTGISAPNRTIYLSWGEKGTPQGPYNQTTSSNASDPKYALVISQLNATAVPLQNVSLVNRTAQISQPGGVVFDNAQPEFGLYNALVNGTVFISLVDDDSFYTPNNLSLVVNHTVAGPGLYIAA